MEEGSLPFADVLIRGEDPPHIVAMTADPTFYREFSDDAAPPTIDPSIVFPQAGDQMSAHSFCRALLSGTMRSGRLATTLDESQCQAIHSALTRRVAIIQGPPGLHDSI